MKKYIIFGLILTQSLIPISKKDLHITLKKLIKENRIEKAKEILSSNQLTKKEHTKLLFYSVKKGKNKIAKFLINNLETPVAYATDISKEIERKIKDKSYKAEIAKKIGVGIKNLAYINIVHFGFDKKYHIGPMVIHKKLVDDAIGIFTDMCKACYPIEKIRLIDDYNADDDLSMGDNNSCALCQRYITGRTDVYSNHSFGTAIDINPIENPYQKGEKIYPPESKKYLDRKQNKKGLIKEGDPCHLAFTKRGWDWGGSWMQSKGYVDYQHFAKDPSVLKD